MTEINNPYNLELLKLIEKYKEGSLSPHELARLREQTGHMSDDALARMIESCSDSDLPELSDERAGKIIDKVMMRRSGVSVLWARVLKPFSIAAAILIPLLLVAAFMFYHKASHFETYRNVLASEMKVTTGDDENVSVTLPDGSKVQLRSSSTLSYALADFNDTGRSVDLDGFAEFDVAHDSQCPFEISCENMKVRVLGTSFVLEARRGAGEAMLFLKEGSVELTSGLTSESVRVSPDQLAVFNTVTGHFSLRRLDSGNEAIALMRRDMVFTKTPFAEMIATVEKCYGITIDYPAEIYADKRFTGYIPSRNLKEALSIIENAYSVMVRNEGDSIAFAIR